MPDAMMTTVSGTRDRRAALGRYVLGRGALTAGAAVTNSVVPLVAAVTLDANSTQMGLLVGIGLAVSLVMQVPLAVWSDRRRDQLQLVVRAAAASAAVSLLIPVLWWADLLTLGSLYACMLAAAVAAAVRSSLGHAIVNDIAAPDERVDAVGRLNGVSSGAEIGGQSAGSGLIVLMPAPVVPVVDSALAVLGTGLLRRVRATTPAAPSTPQSSGTTEVSLASVTGQLMRRGAVWLVISIAAIGGLTEPVFVLFVLRDLGIPAAAVGPLVACGAVGGILGGFLVGRLARTVGEPATLALGAAAMGLSVIPVILARSAGIGAVAVVLFEFFSALGGTVLIALVFGRLQATTDRQAIARTMSSAEVLMQVFGLLGLGIGILLATAVDRRTSFVIYLAAMAVVLVALLIATLRARAGHQRSDMSADPGD